MTKTRPTGARDPSPGPPTGGNRQDDRIQNPYARIHA